MAYYFIKLFVYLASKAYYKKIIVKGKEIVPLDKPLLFVSNHQNAFLDAILIGIFIKPEIHILVRASAFKKPRVKRFLMKHLHLIPIFRERDNVDIVEGNNETFSICYDIFHRKGTVVIFPEGDCYNERKIRSLKKGASRIAFGSLTNEKLPSDLHVVVVGMNYSKSWQYRSELNIQYHECFPVSEYLEMYQNEKAKAVTTLTKRIAASMEECTIDVRNSKHEFLMEDLEDIVKPDILKNVKNKADKDFFVSKTLSNFINHNDVHSPEQLTELRNQITEYKEKLNALDLRDWLVMNPSSSSWREFFLHSVTLLLGMPYYIFGVIHNYIPYRATDAIARKTVKELMFNSSIKVAAGMFVFLFTYLISIFIALGLSDSWFSVLAYSVLLFFSGYYSISYWESLKKMKGRIKFMRLNASLRNDLILKRKELIEQFKRMNEF